MAIGRKIFEIYGEAKLNDQKMVASIDKLKNKLKVVSAAIIALGVGAVKLASDFEEANAKFVRTFEGIEDAANKTAKALQEGYGLSELEAKKLLGTTGDLLKGFGATSSQALQLSSQVQELAVDLASYNNLQGGSARASEILTKAMLGEREALISLGIKISEADVQQKLLEKGQKELTGQAMLLAKSQATLELAYAQTEGAQGDFSRTQDSLANQMRQLKGDVVDLAVSFGQQLIPIAKDIVEKIRAAVEWFTGLSDSTKKTILQIGALIAVAPAVISAIQGISAAIAFLAANPIVAVIGGIVALVAALDTLEKKDQEAKLENFIKELKEANIEIDKAVVKGEEMFLVAAKYAIKIAKTNEELTNVVRNIADRLNITNSEAARFASLLVEAEGTLKNQLREIEKQQTFWEQRAELSAQNARTEALALRDYVKQQEILEAIAETEAEAARLAAERAEKDKTLQLYNDMLSAIDRVNFKRQQGLLDEEQQLTQILSLRESYLDNLLDMGIAFDDARVRNATAQIKLYEEAIANLGETVTKTGETVEEVIKDLPSAMNLAGQEIKEANEDAADDVENKWKDTFDNIVSYTQQISDGIKDIFSEVAKNQKLSLDQRYEDEKAAIENSLMSEEDKAAAIVALDEKTTKEKKKLARQNAITEKTFALFNIAVNTATAITKALSELGPVAGPIMAAVVGAIGAVQAGIVASRPIPALAEGGLATGDTIARIGEGRYQEAVLPLSEDIFNRIGSGIANAVANNQTVNNTTVNNNAPRQTRVEIAGREIFRMIDDGFIDGFLPKIAEAIG